MHHGWRRKRDLRRRTRDRREKLEIVDEDAPVVGPRELAGYLHGRWAVRAIAFGRMKAHGELGRDHPHVAKFQHEIPVPGVAGVFFARGGGWAAPPPPPPPPPGCGGAGQAWVGPPKNIFFLFFSPRAARGGG